MSNRSSVRSIIVFATCGLRIPLSAPLGARNRALLVGVCHDQARIDRKPLSANKACRDACLHDPLEHAAENIAVAEPLVARARESRVIGDPVFDAQAAEPSVRQVHLHLTANRPL
jgi:hypothetical protein